MCKHCAILYMDSSIHGVCDPQSGFLEPALRRYTDNCSEKYISRLTTHAHTHTCTTEIKFYKSIISLSNAMTFNIFFFLFYSTSFKMLVSINKYPYTYIHKMLVSTLTECQQSIMTCQRLMEECSPTNK